MKKLIVLSIYTLLFSLARGQDPDICVFTISGHVIDEHDQQPLSNALLTIKENGEQTWSDSLGNYLFKNICAGQYTIVCLHPGCDTIVKTVYVSKNTIQHFEPEHHSEMLKAINIMAVQTIVIPNPGIESGALRGNDLLRVRSNSIAEMIKVVPGVVVQSTGATISKPVIHGMEGNRLMIINNGVPLEGQQWGSEHAPEIDPLTAGNIEVIRGARTIRYGLGSMGGVILMNPKLINTNYYLGGEYFAGASSNGRQLITSAMLEGRLKKHTQWFARAQGSYARGGNFRTPDYFVNNTGINNYNYSLSTGYMGLKTNIQAWHSRVKSELGIFTGSHVANLTDLLNAFNQSESFSDTTRFSYTINHPRQQILHEISKVNISHQLNVHNMLNLTYARQFNHRQEFDAHGGAEEEEDAALDMMATTHYVKAHWVRSKKHMWEAGISGNVKRNTWEGRFLIPNYRSKQAGVYVLNESNIRYSRLRYSIGARYDIYNMEAWLWQDTVISNPQFDFSGASAQFSLKYAFSYKFDISLNTGMGWRPPAVNELFSNGLHHGAAAYETGNLQLKKENVYHADVTITRMMSRLNGTFSVYADRFTDFIYLRPDLQPVLTVQGAFPSFSFQQANALVYGGDALMEIPIHTLIDYSWKQKLSFQANGSVLWGRNISTNDFLPFMPANRFGYSLKYGTRDFRKVRGLFFALSAQHVLKQQNVQANGDYVPAPEGYALLNMQTGLQLKAKNQWIDISLEGNNLLNKKYRDYLNRFRYYTNEAGINFMLRVTIPFAIVLPKPESPDEIEIY